MFLPPKLEFPPQDMLRTVERVLFGPSSFCGTGCYTSVGLLLGQPRGLARLSTLPRWFRAGGRACEMQGVILSRYEKTHTRYNTSFFLFIVLLLYYHYKLPGTSKYTFTFQPNSYP